MKKETLEESVERLYPFNPYLIGNGIKYDEYAKERRCFIEGAKWQQERMYSEEDMIEFLDWSKSTNQDKSLYELKCLLAGTVIDSKVLFNNWFEQLKKEDKQ